MPRDEDPDEDYPFLQKRDVHELTDAVRSLTRVVGTRVEKVERDGNLQMAKLLTAVDQIVAGQRELNTKLEQLLDVLVEKRTNGGTHLAEQTGDT